MASSALLAAGPATAASGTSQRNLEATFTRIASKIAARNVTVRCEGADAWRRLTNGSPYESGFVEVWYSNTGIQRVATYAELDGARICAPLQAFAAARIKPTQCRVSGGATSPPAPCYEGDHRYGLNSQTYWNAYAAYAQALLTLAHESIHLRGIVHGGLADGRVVGDPLAEAKATCYGMQWVPWVATALGDSWDDGYAIARFLWEEVYPDVRAQDPSYWSASCVPGGVFDTRAATEKHWP